MNAVGLHIGYWWGTGQEHDIFRMLELTHQAELDAMELNPAWLLQLSNEECRELRLRAEDYGMILTLNGGLDATNDISSDDPDIRQEGILYCTKVLRRMPLLGLHLWSGMNYSAWLRAPLLNGEFLQEQNRARELSIQSLQQILPVAEDLNIDYCFEICNRFEEFVLNTAEEAVSFARAVDSPRAKVHLDTFHMNIEEDNAAEAIIYTGRAGKLGHLHIGESNRRIPGIKATQIDWNSIANALKAVNYDGAVIMEPFVLPAAHNARRTRTWRTLCESTTVEDLTRDARTGGQFLRNLLK